jgi:cytochrome oxidase Cu insertion factor (SCO1/SenC/PrrC family)
MMRKISLAFSLLVLLIASVSYAQLGPKDGAGLSYTDLERVKVGSPAPDFALEGMDGKQIALSDYRGKKNVVLVFYRGQW